MVNFFRQVQATATALLVFTILLGGLYPLVTTAIVQSAFSHQANGSLIRDHGQVIGSELIGQNFTKPGYLWGRLSATSPSPYNAGASSGSNLGVNNPALVENVKARVTALDGAGPVPVDLVTASGSGLDPEISPAAAEYQVARIAAARNMGPDDVRDAIHRATRSRTFGILGEPRVNVLEVNLRLDGKLK
jgi:K+-transporting ATPase ATPase C chain